MHSHLKQNVYLHGLNSLLMGRYACSSPSTKVLHGLGHPHLQNGTISSLHCSAEDPNRISFRRRCRPGWGRSGSFPAWRQRWGQPSSSRSPNGKERNLFKVIRLKRLGYFWNILSTHIFSQKWPKYKLTFGRFEKSYFIIWTCSG